MKLKNISPEDLIWVFEFEHGRTQTYFDLMYRSLQFTFAAAIAVIVVAFRTDIEIGAASLLLTLILPVCIYIFGMLYALNAYSLAVCGKRAEIIRGQIFCDTINQSSDNVPEDVKEILVTYVGNKRFISLISYGVALGCFIVAPIVSLILGFTLFSPYNSWIKIVSICGLGLYIILMTIVIVAIAKNYDPFQTIQKRVQDRGTTKTGVRQGPDSSVLKNPTNGDDIP